MVDDEEPDYELIEPEDLLSERARNPFPADARRLGFDRYSDEGAMIALAASLDPTKTSHRIVAWVMLVSVTMPLLLTLWYELR
jgi:hypothetical protein